MKKILVVGSGITAALAGAALIAGCGSGGSVGGGTLSGNASAPSSQMAMSRQNRSLFAMVGASLFGEPASATAPGGNTPLAGATVTIQTRITHQGVAGPVTTSADGSFSIVLPPNAHDVEVDVVNAAHTIEVSAPIPTGGASSIKVDEVSTVGTHAAETDESLGATPDEADQDAAEVEADQAADEQANPSHVPNVHSNHVTSPDGPLAAAQNHLTANLGLKLEALLGHSAHAPTARQGVMAAVTYARVNYGTPYSVFGRNWIFALVNGAATYSDAQIAAGLVAAGVTGAASADVDTALAGLNTTLGSSFTADSIPAAVVVLIALEPGADQLTTRAELDALVSSLTGTTVHSDAVGGTSGGTAGGTSGGTSGGGTTAGTTAGTTGTTGTTTSGAATTSAGPGTTSGTSAGGTSGTTSGTTGTTNGTTGSASSGGVTTGVTTGLITGTSTGAATSATTTSGGSSSVSTGGSR
jgi:hypothetical protein